MILPNITSAYKMIVNRKTKESDKMNDVHRDALVQKG